MHPANTQYSTYPHGTHHEGCCASGRPTEQTWTGGGIGLQGFFLHGLVASPAVFLKNRMSRFGLLVVVPRSADFSAAKAWRACLLGSIPVCRNADFNRACSSAFKSSPFSRGNP